MDTNVRYKPVMKPQSIDLSPITDEGEKIFRARLDALRSKHSHLFCYLLALEAIVGILVARFIAPTEWREHPGIEHGSLPLAMVAACLAGWAGYQAYKFSAARSTRHLIAVVQIVFSILFIHLSAGRIEMHFHLFVSLALLAFYADTKVLWTATCLAVMDHIVRALFWPESIFGEGSAGVGRALEHIAWLLVLTVFLWAAARQRRRDILNSSRQEASVRSLHHLVEQEKVELELAHRKIKGAEERYALAFTATNDILWDWDIWSGHVDVSDHYYERFLVPRSAGSSVYDQWVSLIHPDERERVVRSLGDVIANGKDYWEEEFRFRKGDAYAYVVDRARVIRNSSGSAVRMVGAMQDISARKEIENTLALARQVAEDASIAKSEFLANMSHEIRTPMNGIIGMTDLLLEVENDPEKRDNLLTIEHSAGALLHIINDILDFSKIEARKLDFDQVEFNLRSVVEEAARAVSLAAHKKGVELVCDMEFDMPTWVVGDPGRLRQVLLNLLNNAIKFTPQGEVALMVACESLDPEHATIQFSIRDTGTGIPAHKLKAIFDPFTQVDGSSRRKHGGTGLGLTISNSLVQMMGGTIAVTSELGKGSTFCFSARFPISQSQDKGRLSAPLPLAGSSVLLVDDNPTNRAIVVKMLERSDARVVPCAGAVEALDALRVAKEEQRAFDILLTDRNMPGMDGFQLVERIRAIEPLCPAIVMLTSDDQKKDSARCRALGIERYLLKPIRAAELQEAMCLALGKHHQRSTLQNSETANAGRLKTSRLGEQQRVLVVEDNIVNQKLVAKILTKAGHEVVIASNGLAAITEYSSRKFDLILMDVQLPDMDGFQATTQIRRLDTAAGTHTRIVALTAHALQGDKEKCLQNGMDEYLAKPIRPQQLLALVGECKQQTSAQKAEGDHTRFDRKVLDQFTQGDASLERELIGLCEEHLPIFMTEIEDGIKLGDMEQVKRGTHSLRGSLAVFGAQGAIRAAEQMERAASNCDQGALASHLAHLRDELETLGNQFRSLFPRETNQKR